MIENILVCNKCKKYTRFCNQEQCANGKTIFHDYEHSTPDVIKFLIKHRHCCHDSISITTEHQLFIDDEIDEEGNLVEYKRDNDFDNVELILYKLSESHELKSDDKEKLEKLEVDIFRLKMYTKFFIENFPGLSLNKMIALDDEIIKNIRDEKYKN